MILDLNSYLDYYLTFYFRLALWGGADRISLMVYLFCTRDLMLSLKLSKDLKMGSLSFPCHMFCTRQSVSQ